MKLRNRNQKWSEKDVYILVRLMREQVPYATIAAVLGRSEASLRHAIKNTLYQQLLHHMPTDIMTYYKMKEDEELYENVVAPVYYQEIEKTGSDAEQDASGDEEEEDANSEEYTSGDEEDANSEEEYTSGDEEDAGRENRVCDFIVTSALTFLVAAGGALYVHILKQNWNQS